jgi:uncharacterized protein YbjT (DUF2867 family)
MTNHKQDSDLTLVLGGTGKTGRRVAHRLRELGGRVRVGSRRGQPSFDWNDRSGWDDALDGVTSAYLVYYPDVAFPGADEVLGAFASAATTNGVERVVLLRAAARRKP